MWVSGTRELIGTTPTEVVAYRVNESIRSLSVDPPVALFERPSALAWDSVMTGDGETFCWVQQAGLERHTLTIVGDWRSRLN